MNIQCVQVPVQYRWYQYNIRDGLQDEQYEPGGPGNKGEGKQKGKRYHANTAGNIHNYREFLFTYLEFVQIGAGA
jgi:hypothetical protein